MLICTLTDCETCPALGSGCDCFPWCEYLREDGADVENEHYVGCIKLYPACMCNKCKHDRDNGEACCYHRTEFCPVSECEKFEIDDEKSEG